MDENFKTILRSKHSSLPARNVIYILTHFHTNEYQVPFLGPHGWILQYRNFDFATRQNWPNPHLKFSKLKINFLNIKSVLLDQVASYKLLFFINFFFFHNHFQSRRKFCNIWRINGIFFNVKYWPTKNIPSQITRAFHEFQRKRRPCFNYCKLINWKKKK